MKSEFEIYCTQLPVIGFNSGKYDINLIKSELVIQLGLHKSTGRKFILKRVIITYAWLMKSYDSFSETFDVKLRKSYFPYEYLTNVSKLDETRLPPKECFFSSLKNCNTLENKLRVKYCTLIEKENKSVDETLKLLQISDIPPSTIDENNAYLQKIWEKKNMSTLRDFFYSIMPNLTLAPWFRE